MLYAELYSFEDCQILDRLVTHQHHAMLFQRVNTTTDL